jgi:hypothetical protein
MADRLTPAKAGVFCDIINLMDDSLHIFIKQALEQGQTKEQIEQELLAKGWDVPVVQTTISEVVSQQNLNAYSAGQVEPVNTTTQNEQSKVFISENPSQIVSNKSKLPKIIIAGVVVLLAVGSVAVYWYVSQSIDGSTSPAQIVEQTTTENVDTTYAPYTNDEYGFSMNLPLNWSTKDFAMGSYGEQKRMAFGKADQLPQEIFLDGEYVWIKIYPFSSANDYKDYIYLKSLVGEDDSVTERQLGGVTGIANNEFIAVEHNDMIYEIHLLRDPSTMDYTADSYEIIRSFTFK